MKYALVAGGSKGIGFAIAAALAKRKYNLILVARHSESLVTAKDSLEATYKITVEIIEQDLSLPDAANKIAAWCNKKKVSLKMLCNVAGLGGSNDYLKLPQDDLRYMISLNLSFPVTLCLELLPLLEKAAPSFILNVASMAAFAPIPAKNLYSATKSGVLFFSYSLHYQLKKKKISVSCLCPGPVFTKPEIVKTTLEKMGWMGKAIEVDPFKVGEIAVTRTLKRKLVITPGFLAGSISFIIRLLPRRLITFIYSKMG